MTEIKKVEKAQEIIQKIIELRNDTALNVLKLGALLKVVRDEELYLLSDHETFAAFLADPLIGFKRATVYYWIHMYEFYVIENQINPADIAKLPMSNLQVVLPMIKEHPEELQEWMAKAESLGRKDLIDEVRERRHLPPLEIKVSDTTVDEPLMKYDDYLAFVKAHPCILHPTKKIGYGGHHFPRTKGHGGKEHDWKRIPLCPECHSLYHSDPVDFTLTYLNQIMDYFYAVILKAYRMMNEFTK